MLNVNGLTSEGTTPDVYVQQIRRDLDRWQKVVHEAGMSPQ